MPYIPKTSRREHSAETLAIIISLHNKGKSLAQIGNHLNLSRPTVATIIHRHHRQPDHPLRPTKRAGRPPKLDGRDKRALVRHVEQNPHDNLKALGTPSKSGQTLSRATVRKYLKANGYFRFKARKKPFLSSKHKQARLKWAKEHRGWTMDDWYRVI